MQRLEQWFGMAALALYALTGVLAVFVLGTLIVKGVPDRTPEYIVAARAAAEAAAANPDAGAEDTPASGSAPSPEPAVEMAAAVDPAAGEKVFAKCKACHTADSGKADRIGPHLWGVFDRPVASVEGFAYSDAMAGHGGNWTVEELDAYLADPKGDIPGNKMAFAGLKDTADRQNVIAWLAAQSDSPVAADALSFAGVALASADAAATAEPADDTPQIAQIAYTDPPEPGEDEIARIAARLEELQAEIPTLDYQRARYLPIHNQPEINAASDQECLACHQEILDREVRLESPAGLKSTEALAWYQTLDTYIPQDETGQSNFHWRHISSPLAQQTMNLQCNFCHQGNDPREESPDLVPLRAAFSADATSPEFTLRKMVNPSETCLRCHGAMPDPEGIMGLYGEWPEIRADLEDQTSDDPTLANGCLSCHQDLYRTNRHNVTYLKAAGIEELAQSGSDTCYGCHGGRAWYRISYPYPRHPWPDMDPTLPEWAANRPTSSDERFQRPAN
ncbi:cytochrome c family protein [Paracoccus sp. SCSIO 75233]|uniref:c-type cytochrome n=1 Tax=Paracoccus sp. SCSIO 75233 TaxID=3017782 RepID=UPI0022EFE86E|nr:cytochrome c family protein [Paracoccus sp. SCSIO 75233]WBU54205.1 cytochrome c family protein [Paracoccus sp. SCSIO 75233]